MSAKDQNRPARYRLTFGLAIPDDLAALAEVDPEVLDATQVLIDDLAYGRVHGKLLGERYVSGDLTGLARVKFDVSNRRLQRFRLVYRQVDEHTRHVVAIGFRDEHAIYQIVARRITQTP